MKTISMLLIAGLVALAGCGGDEKSSTPGPTQGADAAMKSEDAADAARTKKAEDAAMKQDAAEDEAMARATKVNVGGSEYGDILVDSKQRAIYIFEHDPKGRSVCYGACAAAWPPVFTDGKPISGKGVKAALLGTVKRRGGKVQVTYAGKPLYYYAHEGPGEVKCHNVNLNGGFWWVVGPDGKRRAA